MHQFDKLFPEPVLRWFDCPGYIIMFDNSINHPGGIIYPLQSHVHEGFLNFDSTCLNCLFYQAEYSFWAVR